MHITRPRQLSAGCIDRGTHADTKKPLPNLSRIATGIIALLLSMVLTLMMQVAVAQTAEQTAKSFNVPAGNLEDALNTFAQQAGITLSFNPDLVQGKQAAGLSGRYTVQKGLNTLLTDQDLEAEQAGDGAYLVRPQPVTDVEDAGRQSSATTAEDDTVLPEMMVTGEAQGGNTLPVPYAGGQVASGGRLGLLGNTDFMDAPFSITSYTEQTITDKQARSVADVLVYESAVRNASARTNINEDFTIRGFPVASQDIALNGMYGLMPYFRVPIEMAERVEVLKGPSALLTGMPPSGNIGGAINIVPKRAGTEPITRLTTEYLSDSVFGGHIDVGRRFGDNNAFGARFNGVIRGGDTFVDNQSTEEKLASLGLDYRGERLRVSSDILYQNQNIDGVVRQFTASPAVTAIPDAPDGTTSYPGNWTDLDMEDTSGVLRAEYDLASSMTVYAGAGARRSRMNAVAGNPMLINNTGGYVSSPGWQLFDIDSSSFEAGISSAFNTGPVSHQLTVGTSKVNQDSDIFFYTAFAPRNSNLYAPVDSPEPDLTGINVDKNRYQETALTSYAIVDTFSFANDRVALTLGARHQQVETQNYNSATGQPSAPEYDEDAITPMAGLVVKPWQHVSLYASYIEGLSQGPTAPNDLTLTNPGEIFPPVESTQLEVGMKVDWSNLGGTLAFYDLEKPSGIRVGNTFDVSGKQRHRGAELNLFGQITPRIRVLGGMSYIDSELTRTASGVNEGNTAVGVPELQFNLGGEWDTPFLPGLTLNMLVIHTSEQYVDQANNLEVPDWTRVDIGARYKIDTLGKPLVFRASVENVLDESYWGVANAGYLHVGEPRTVLLSATIDF